MSSPNIAFQKENINQCSSSVSITNVIDATAYPQGNINSLRLMKTEYVFNYIKRILSIFTKIDRQGYSWSKDISYENFFYFILENEPDNQWIFDPSFLLLIDRLRRALFNNDSLCLNHLISQLKLLLIEKWGGYSKFPPSFFEIVEPTLIFPVSSKYVISFKKPIKFDEKTIRMFILAFRNQLSEIKKFQWLNENMISIYPKIYLSNHTEVCEIEGLYELNDNKEEQQAFSSEQMPELLVELESSIEFLHEVWPEAYQDFSAFCKRIVPVYMPNEIWWSKSTPNAPLAQIITIKPMADFLLHAEQMVHETSHIKIDICEMITPLFNKEDENPSFIHPWRKEARSIRGVLYGIHAFIAVLGLYRLANKQLNLQWSQDYEHKLVHEIASALPIMEKAHLSASGQILMDRLTEKFEELTYKKGISNSRKITTSLGEADVTKYPFSYATVRKVNLIGLDETLVYLKETLEWHRVKKEFYDQWELIFTPIQHGNLLKIFNKEELQKINLFLETVYGEPFYPIFTIGAHYLTDGQGIGIHTDRRVELGESHRLVIQLNEHWEEDYGGELIFFNSNNPQDVHEIVSPYDKSLATFQCCSRSFHAVSDIKKGKRYTLIFSAWQKRVDDPSGFLDAVIKDNDDKIFEY